MKLIDVLHRTSIVRSTVATKIPAETQQAVNGITIGTPVAKTHALVTAAAAGITHNAATIIATHALVVLLRVVNGTTGSINVSIQTKVTASSAVALTTIPISATGLLVADMTTGLVAVNRTIKVAGVATVTA